MKLFLFLLILVPTGLFAQTKILFDATKAEMAGNADWVIDADSHNLGEANNGAMVSGRGNESNPQRFPTPAQSGITQSTAETYWEGSLSSWGVDIVKKGYEVETLPYNGAITYGDNNNTQDLSNYKVFICDEPNIRFTSSEQDALVQFVQNGGGLFMISDHDQSDRNGDGWDSPHIWNDLMSNNSIHANPFGISFDYQNFSETSANIASLISDSCLHGPLGDVTEIKYSNGTSITLNSSQNSSVKGLIYKTGSSTTGSTNVLFATCRFGNGKVAALGDSSPPDDGTGDPNDNSLYSSYAGEANGSHRKLLMNTTIWLVGSTADTSTTDTTHTGIQSLVSDLEFKVYPNPAGELLNIDVGANNEENLSIKIFDAAGREVFKPETLSEREMKIDISILPAGVYFVRVNNVVKKIFKLP